MASPRTKIVVTDLARVERLDAGSVCLTLVDAGGETVTLALTQASLGAVAAALLGQMPPVRDGEMAKVEAWRMAPRGDGTEFRLSLHTTAGHAAHFLVTPGQVAGMATLVRFNDYSTRPGVVN